MKITPIVDMEARIVRLGAEERVVVEEVRDGGHVVVAGGEIFTLRRLTGRFVRQGEPYYGARLVLAAAGRGDTAPRR